MRAEYAVGVDVGGGHIAVGLMSRDGRVAKQLQAQTPVGSADAIIETIVRLIAETTAGVSAVRIAGVGVGVPALMDFANQSLEWCTNLPLAGVDVRGRLSAGTRHVVTLDNDANCAAMGELRFGAAKDVRDVVMLTLGTGVGGALVFDGEVYRGSRGMAGEIGHMVVRIGGRRCPCGADGHLEAYIGSRAIAARGAEISRTPAGAALLARTGGTARALNARDVIETAAAGDAAAIGVLVEAGEILGEALVGIVNLLNPRLIVLGGGIGESADILVERAAQVIAEKALEGRCDVEVVQALLGNDTGVLGAAALAFDEHDRHERDRDEREQLEAPAS